MLAAEDRAGASVRIQQGKVLSSEREAALLVMEVFDAVGEKDELGSMQLVEIDTDGTRTPLTDLPGRCTGRYLPGRRTVVVQHDAGGDERWQLSALDLDGPRSAPATLEDLRPLVRDARYLHTLHDVTETGLVYATNRRNGVDMDVVESGTDARGPYAVADASLWADDLCIYRVRGLGMRVVSDAASGGPSATRTSR